MSVATPSLRHLGNDAADRLVLYLQDDTPLSDQLPHVTCNPRCHVFDAGVVAGRMPEILDDERRVSVEAFVSFAGELIDHLDSEHGCTEVLEYRAHLQRLVWRARQGGRGMIAIRVVIEDVNQGGPPARPARACAFSGCREPKDRLVEPWPLCAAHADRVEALRAEAGR